MSEISIVRLEMSASRKKSRLNVFISLGEILIWTFNIRIIKKNLYRNTFVPDIMIIEKK